MQIFPLHVPHYTNRTICKRRERRERVRKKNLNFSTRARDLIIRKCIYSVWATFGEVEAQRQHQLFYATHTKVKAPICKNLLHFPWNNYFSLKKREEFVWCNDDVLCTQSDYKLKTTWKWNFVNYSTHIRKLCS